MTRIVIDAVRPGLFIPYRFMRNVGLITKVAGEVRLDDDDLVRYDVC